MIRKLHIHISELLMVWLYDWADRERSRESDQYIFINKFYISEYLARHRILNTYFIKYMQNFHECIQIFMLIINECSYHENILIRTPLSQFEYLKLNFKSSTKSYFQFNCNPKYKRAHLIS